jgi:recombination protein RecR
VLPDPIKKFTETFSQLPAIGPRLAARLGLYLASLSETDFLKFKNSFENLQTLNRCPWCFSLKEKANERCILCEDKNRNHKLVAIVEKETDIESIEKSGAFKGLYLVVGEASHNATLGEAQKNILREFKNNIIQKKRTIEEIIIALPHNAFGDFLGNTIEQGLSGIVPKITHLGRGIPTGGAIEFADEETLRNAIQRRG